MLKFATTQHDMTKKMKLMHVSKKGLVKIVAEGKGMGQSRNYE